MNKNLINFIFLILILMPNSVRASSEGSIHFIVGSSSNPTLIDETAPSEYIILNPTINLTHPASEDLWLFLSSEIFYKDYAKKEIANASNFSKIDLELGLTRFISDRHEMGFTASALRDSKNELDYNSSGLNLKGRTTDSLQSLFEVYHSYNLSSFNFQTTIGQINRNFYDVIKDELLNEFEDDYRQFNLSVESEYKLNSTLTLLSSLTMSERSYQFRTAKNTEGTPNLSNPTLIEFHQAVELGLQFKQDQLRALIKTRVAREKDRIFGAEDADYLSLISQLDYPIFDSFSIGAALSVSQRKYDHFVIDPFNDPAGRDLRSDLDKNIEISVSFPVFLIPFQLKFNQVTRNSNYLASGASYENNKIEFSSTFTY